jgi:iron(III) transport system substrate-binding protein
VHRTVTSRPRVVAAVLALVLAAFVGASVSYGAPSAKSPFPASAPTKAAWNRVIAKAKQEGTVTVYSAQAPTTLAALGAAFKNKYGINVTVNRQVDAVMVQQITAEQGSNKPVADLWVQASKNYTLGAVKNGWVTPPIGPSFYAKGYDRTKLLGPGPTAIVAAAVLGMAWNTSLYPQGIADIPGFLDPRLTGKIGIPQPTSASFIDWYLWLEETYGQNILTRLAAQKPKIYLSSLTMMQAVISGEITASPFVPPLALDQRKLGAPINFKLATKDGKTWNAPFWGMILKNAPHPNAAQLLADFMVTKEGQAAVQHLSGAVIDGATETFYVAPRVPNLKNFTPAKIAAFQARWKALFQP